MVLGGSGGWEGEGRACVVEGRGMGFAGRAGGEGVREIGFPEARLEIKGELWLG